MKDKIVVVGGGGHAKVLISIIKNLDKYEIIGYTDLVDKGLTLGVEYLGNDEVLYDIIKKYRNCKAVIGIGFVSITNKRQKIFEMLKEMCFDLPVIISKNAKINEEVTIAEGSVVLECAIINVSSIIGRGVIINSGAIVEHDCEIGDFTHIATGVVLSGGVKINNNCLIGSGSTILPYKEIGANCLIGSGSLVTKNCLEPGTYIGNPVRKI